MSTLYRLACVFVIALISFGLVASPVQSKTVTSSSSAKSSATSGGGAGTVHVKAEGEGAKASGSATVSDGEKSKTAEADVEGDMKKAREMWDSVVLDDETKERGKKLSEKIGEYIKQEMEKLRTGERKPSGKSTEELLEELKATTAKIVGDGAGDEL